MYDIGGSLGILTEELTSAAKAQVEDKYVRTHRSKLKF